MKTIRENGFFSRNMTCLTRSSYSDRVYFMPSHESTPTEVEKELRRCAEERIAERERSETAPLSEEMPRVVHELSVHQVELEMQNEALRNSQLELEESRDRYAHLYDSAPIGYLTLDQQGCIEEINLTACRMLGGDRSQLLGKRAVNYVHTDAKNCFVHHLQRCRMAREGERLLIDVNLKPRSGVAIPVHICTTPTVDVHRGERRYLTAMLNESELRRAEQHACEADRRLVELFACITDAFMSLDSNWRFVYVNDHACQVLHKSREELLGSVFWAVFPEAAEMPEYDPLRLAMEGQTFVAFEVFYPPLETWLSFRCFPSSGGVVVYFLNITEAKHLEAELKAANERLESEVADRTSALEMLHDIAVTANRSQDVTEALQYALRRIVERNGWCFGHAFLPADDDPDLLVPSCVWYLELVRFEDFRRATDESSFRRGCGLPGRVFDTGRPEWSSDIFSVLESPRLEIASQLGLETAAAFPILVEDTVGGVLEFFSRRIIEPSKRTLDSMASIGTQLGRVIERKAFQSRLLTIADDQQRHLGQELHDDIGQELTGLVLKAETLAESLANDQSRWSHVAKDIICGLDRVQRKTRVLAHGLIPLDIEAPIIEAALQDLAQRTNASYPVSCRFCQIGESRVADTETATQLLRIAQEAVSNALQHADAHHVEIELSNTAKSILLAVRDDGKGPPSEVQRIRGMGLKIMEQRAGLIGGTLTMDSVPSGGTEITCRVKQKRVKQNGVE